MIHILISGPPLQLPGCAKLSMNSMYQLDVSFLPLVLILMTLLPVRLTGCAYLSETVCFK